MSHDMDERIVEPLHLVDASLISFVKKEATEDLSLLSSTFEVFDSNPVKLETKDEHEPLEQLSLEDEFGLEATEREQEVLQEITSEDLISILDLYNLLEEYKNICVSSKSILCSLSSCHAILTCQLCGQQYMVKYDRLFKLCKHFEKVHPHEATELILDAMRRYHILISHIKRSLEFDKWYIAQHYQANKRCIVL